MFTILKYSLLIYKLYYIYLLKYLKKIEIIPKIGWKNRKNTRKIGKKW